MVRNNGLPGKYVDQTLPAIGARDRCSTGHATKPIQKRVQCVYIFRRFSRSSATTYEICLFFNVNDQLRYYNASVYNSLTLKELSVRSI